MTIACIDLISFYKIISQNSCLTVSIYPHISPDHASTEQIHMNNTPSLSIPASGHNQPSHQKASDHTPFPDCRHPLPYDARSLPPPLLRLPRPRMLSHFHTI